MVDTPLDIGEGPAGRHRIVPIIGGNVEGPALNGVVISGGADWQHVRPDGTLNIEARYAIRADDGAVIEVLNRGLRHGPAAVLERVAAGQFVDPAEYYFRATPEFTAPSGPHEWLTRAIFIATGERHSDRVILRVWPVL